MRDQRLLFHKLMYPVWAEDNKHLILLCVVLGMAGGVGGAVLVTITTSSACMSFP